MAELQSITLIAAIICLGLSVIASIWQVAALKISTAETSSAQVTINNRRRISGYAAISLGVFGLLLITTSIAARAVITGHGPFSNMYEFAIAFSWGIVAIGLFFHWRYRVPIINTLGIIIAMGLLIFANALPSRIIPLMPALQQSLLLTTHVAAAVITYGAFTVGFVTALLYLISNQRNQSSLPPPQILEDISYHSVIIGFPFMTLVIVLGALWADIAWGRYWSWDPKETASLVTWLLYASYLHARVVRGWRGKKTAIILVLGFCAVIFTFLGNYIFTGLHSYN